MSHLIASTIELPIGWLLSSILGLGGVIATLAGIIYRILTDRLDAQDKLIDHLKIDVERMRKGCGVSTCLWKDHHH
jgi:hypothetical protein